MCHDGAMASEPKYDLYSDRFRAETYETFAQMRAHHPVLRQPGLDGTTTHWYITRYDDAVAALLDDTRLVRDPALAFSPDELAAVRAATPKWLEGIEEHMLNREGEEHRRLRRLVARAFTPRMIEQLRPRTQQIADQMVDVVEPRGEMDVIDDLSFPLSITVIAELLGVAASDRERFRSWSRALVSPALDPESEAHFGEAMNQLVPYLRETFVRRRATPGNDLLSALLQVNENGDTLTEPQLVSMAVLLIVAGHETTVSAIANAVLALLDHPDVLADFLLEPSVRQHTIEELLRYNAAVERAMTRWAAVDLELGDQMIPRGDRVIIVLGSANRDGAEFPDPHRLDIARPDNKHLAFGRGTHYCLGAPLARMEIEIALTTLFRRLPDVRLAVEPDQLAWRPVPMFRALAALPLVW
jgi:cytochrome P450